MNEVILALGAKVRELEASESFYRHAIETASTTGANVEYCRGAEEGFRQARLSLNQYLRVLVLAVEAGV